jgi:uncharacterized protein (TIGR03437 family)
VLKNSDFSIVQSDNPASAGDVLLIYATGLGQTMPVSETGTLAAFPPQRNTVPVTVTVGGVNAPVVYTIASPGFAGLYQTAVELPSGVPAGAMPLIIRAASVDSNTVTIAVR